MPAHQPTTIRAHGPEDVLALIPFVLRFPPVASLVVLTVDEASDALLDVTRLDLPAAGELTDRDHAALDHLITGLAAYPGPSVLLAGYGPAERVEPMAAAADAALHTAGIPVRDVLRVADGRYWRLCGDPQDFPPDGIAFDAAASPAAAAAVSAGLAVLPDRQALAATLAPVTGPGRVLMIAATAVACAMVTEVLDGADAEPGELGEGPDAVLDTRIGRALQIAACIFLVDVQEGYRGGQPAGDGQAAILTVLLELPSLWEFAARRCDGQAWQIDMWSDLVRRAEPQFTAQVATLLALCALQAGNSSLASLAVDRALSADPLHRFAHLLDRAIIAGVDPGSVAALFAD